jgi:hypothetical protein
MITKTALSVGFLAVAGLGGSAWLLQACEPDDVVTFRGVVWEDLNGDGRRDDGEPGVADVKVQVLCAPLFGLVLEPPFEICVETTTDADGQYLFSGGINTLQDTSALVQVRPGAGWTFTPQQPDSPGVVSDVDAATGRSETFRLETVSTKLVDAGLVAKPPVVDDPTEEPPPPDTAPAVADTVPEEPPPGATGTIGGVYWKDLDGDGLQDPDEARETAELRGSPVALLDPDGKTLAETAVDATGRYQFSGLTPAGYRVRFPLPGNGRFEFTVRDAGDDTLDSDVDPATGEAEVTLAAGENNETVGAGIHFTG